MPSAFVLMPFDKKFDSVYSDVIKNVLEQEGFEALRADDILSQQNILKDIIQGIVDSDLIVADLTSSNPNVYYELGIAHALGKPAILITQSSPEEVPFDLRQNRVITYSTHFDVIDKVKKELAAYARRFLEGQLEIGNPVTDFYPVVHNLDSLTAPTSNVLNKSDADSKSDEKYKLVQLGKDGHFVQQSIANPKLYICPNCFAKDKIEIALQQEGVQASDPAIQAQYKRYRCHNCKSEFTTHPGSRYHN